MTPETIRDRFFDALKKVPDGHADLRFEVQEGLDFGYRGEQVDHLRTHRSTGGLARVYHRGRWGIATFEDIEEMSEALEEARAAAAWLGEKEEGEKQGYLQALDGLPVQSLVHPARWTRDFRGMKVDDKLAKVGKREKDLPSGLSSLSPCSLAIFLQIGKGCKSLRL